MDKTSQINSLLNARFDKAPIQVWKAIVQSVEGKTCTVAILGNDLVMESVQLRADEDATDGVLLTPRVGSLVLVALIENEVSDLYVCQVSEVDKIEGVIGKVTASMSADGISLVKDKLSMSLTSSGGASLKQDQTEVTLANGKMKLKNSSANLKELFDDLVSLIQSLKVITPVQGAPTPSTSLDPGTIAKLPQLTAKISSILS